MKEVVSEYKSCTVEEVMDLIEGDTLKLGTKAVSPDMANVVTGEKNEEAVDGEASSRFDISFRSLLPGGEGAVGVNLHIDIEIQGDAKPGYPIINRGLYYACRKLTMQLQKVSDRETGYGALEKVYSIWICIENVSKNEQNSIAFYKLVNYNNINIEPKEKGDLLEIIIIRLGNPDESTNTILDMLNGIFTSNKEKVMSFVPKSNPDGVKEVESMLYLYDIMEERGIKKGVEKGIIALIKTCQDLGVSKEETLKRIQTEFEISFEEASEKIKEYWK